MPTIKEILQEISYINFIGDQEVLISQVSNLNPENDSENTMMWVNDKNFHKISSIKKGTIICSNNKQIDANQLCNYIIVDNPRQIFSVVLNKFFVTKKEANIAASASIHETAHIGQNVTIGQNVVIEENCRIGNNTIIGHNTVIYANTLIGDTVKIGSNCTIGGVGFGYEKDETGEYVLIPHIGNVILSNDVEIGNNTTIDRAVMGSTTLDENCKVDNLVHIAHGVHIGKRCLLPACCMIAGSTKIADDVWIGPNASVSSSVTIAQKAFITIGSVVVGNVQENQKVTGNFAIPHNKFLVNLKESLKNK